MAQETNYWQKGLSSRISRRRLLAGAAGGAAGIALAGCGGGEEKEKSRYGWTSPSGGHS